MTPRTVDVVAAGPPSDDPFDPAASAWALAGALAAAGGSVRVVYPGTEGGAAAPAGVDVAPYPAVTAHVGTFRGDAELARGAAHHLRRGADVVVRDPLGFGPVGPPAGSRLVAFVREVASEPNGDAPAPRRRLPLRLPLERFGARGELRRLEGAAVGEANVVCCASPAVRDRLRRVHEVPEERLRVLPSAVATGPTPPDRPAARRSLGLPDDVPFVAILSPPDPHRDRLVAPALDGFGRIRRIFPGSRVAAVGVPTPRIPGIVPAEGGDAATLVTALAAADVGVVVGGVPTTTAALVATLRAGVPCVAPTSVDLGDGSEAALRRTDLGDAGEVASVLAEMLSDAGARSRLAAAGATIAERFAPERVAHELEAAGWLGGR
ncbi:MAG TPA: glycosyltransferase [Thermoplasmata archaeon]|nr:glycosyltransferase [Thermoplasmata archaeon]